MYVCCVNSKLLSQQVIAVSVYLEIIYFLQKLNK